MKQPPVMLSVAGSDPSGGAGVQADLKTATALGVYGAAVITSLTAQNTTGVQGIFEVPGDFVAQQYESVVTDLDVRAVKIGMLGSTDVVLALAAAMRRHRVDQVVLDPVMVAASGDRLVGDDVVRSICDDLIPLASVITPNLAEVATLLGGGEPSSLAEMSEAADALRALGPQAVLVKGGHLPDVQSIDVLADCGGTAEIARDRVDTNNTHGTGCTLSSAIAAHLAGGMSLRSAVGHAKDYVTGALRSGAGWTLGAGSGPVDHLWAR